MTARISMAGATRLLLGVSALALSHSFAQAETPAEAIARIEATGSYLAGDKHNHTTCSDGATSVQVMVNQSVIAFGLDWLVDSGHGGAFNRDCRFSDPEYLISAKGVVGNLQNGLGEGAFWSNTVGDAAIKGDVNLSSSQVFQDPDTPGTDRVRNMWRWQSLAEVNYEATANAGREADKTVWLGLEWNAPGHEHVNVSVIGRQFSGRGDARAVSQFEYLWDAGDQDRTGGLAEGYEDPAQGGVAKIANVAGDHAKSVAAVEWLADNHLTDSYVVGAHVERQGAFTTGQNRGYNVEHFRDYHNAGLLNPSLPTGFSLAFGMESQPGHQASDDGRGTYSGNRPSACLFTFGGTGCYAGAEASLPGVDFEGDPLDAARLAEVAADLATRGETLNATQPRERYVLGRPGVRTMWDAMLGEGRKFFFFGSSDWHNRGEFSPFEAQTTLDFWPGEYQKNHVFAANGSGNFSNASARRLVRGMREGNVFVTTGDLVDQFFITACYDITGRCATMGQTLVVRRGQGNVTFRVEFRDPTTPNNSVYTFDNPSLAQIGISQPLNQPEVHHFDVIRGDITGIIPPTDPAYRTNNSNPSTEIFATFGQEDFVPAGDRQAFEWTLSGESLTIDQYFRLRGTNLPQGTPNETDAEGNPLSDDFANLIPCTVEPEVVSDAFDPSVCPAHLPVNAEGVKIVDADVEAYADLWIYANPIFIDVR